MTTKRRVYYKPDGTVSIVHPALKSKKETETEKQWLRRVYEKTDIHQTGYPYDDILETDIPTDKTTREKWRGSKGAGITVDNNIVTDKEKRRILENSLDTELAKASPDSVKVIRLYRKIEKKDYS